jgi:hypothetical protein
LHFCELYLYCVYCCILFVFVVSYVHLLYLMCICCVLCVFVVSYVYLLYLMCICCTLCVFVVPYVYLLYLMCICCILCVFVVSYVYLLYLMCICCTVYIAVLTLDAGLLAKVSIGRTCDRPPRHRFFLVSLCLQTNAEMVPKFPSCYYVHVM